MLKMFVLELEAFKLSAALKPILVHTHLHLVMCTSDLESLSFVHSSPRRCCHSFEGDSPSHILPRNVMLGFVPLPPWYSPTLPPDCQLTLNVTKPRSFTHLAAKLFGTSYTALKLRSDTLHRRRCNSFSTTAPGSYT